MRRAPGPRGARRQADRQARPSPGPARLESASRLLIRVDIRRQRIEAGAGPVDYQQAHRQVVALYREQDLGALVVGIELALDQLERVELAGWRLHAFATCRLVGVARRALAIRDLDRDRTLRRREGEAPDEAQAVLPQRRRSLRRGVEGRMLRVAPGALVLEFQRTQAVGRHRALAGAPDLAAQRKRALAARRFGQAV